MNKPFYIVTAILLLLASIYSAIKFQEHKEVDLARPPITPTPQIYGANSAEADTKTIELAQDSMAKVKIDTGASESAAASATAEDENKEAAAEREKKKRVAQAAGGFLGFYLANTRERNTFCRQQGVSIDAFNFSFEQAHNRELEKARSTIAEYGISEEKLLENVQSQIQEVVKQEMGNLAHSRKSTLKEACEFFNENSTALSSTMQFSKAKPAMHQSLMEE